MRITAPPKDKYPLTNGGDLELLFLGTGSAFAKTLYQTNFLLVKGETHLLVDCGSRCSMAMVERGLSVMDIQNVLITHSHADHIGGLEELVLMHRYVTKSRPNLVTAPAIARSLWEESLAGGAKYNERAEGQWLKFDDFFKVIAPHKIKNMPRETWEVKLGSLNLKMPRTMHIPDSARSWKDSALSLSLIVDDKVFFTSDTRFDPELVIDYDRKFNFDCIFHDVQFFPGGVHAFFDEIDSLPAPLKKKIVMVHYADTWQKFDPKKIGCHSFAEQQKVYTF